MHGERRPGGGERGWRRWGSGPDARGCAATGADGNPDERQDRDREEAGQGSTAPNDLAAAAFAPARV